MTEHGNIGHDSATTKFHTTFDPTSQPASDAVVSSLSDVVGKSPDEMKAIESVVDPIVFDALVRRRRRPIQISFRYHEHDVTVDTGGEIWIQPPPEENSTEYEFSFDRDEPPSHAVIRAIAEVDGIEPTEVEPLYEFINPDALDAMLGDSTESGDRDVLVSFWVDEFEIEITPDRRVKVRPVSAAE